MAMELKITGALKGPSRRLAASAANFTCYWLAKC